MAAANRKPVSPEAADATIALYRRHGQRVFSFCVSRLRDQDEAQDAVQTSFMYALRALDRGVVPQHELAWLLKIAENVCRSTRRVQGRRRSVISSADVDELGDAMALSADGEDRLGELKAALKQLPANQRRAMLLREWQGLSYADIADELRLSVPAVEALLFRARRTLAAYRERTRSALAAFDLGSLAYAVRPALQSGAAATAGTAAVATLVVAGGPAPARGNTQPPARQPSATAAAGRSTALRPVAVHKRLGSRQPSRLRARTAPRPTHRAVRPPAAPPGGHAGTGGTAAPPPVAPPPPATDIVEHVVHTVPPVALPPPPPIPPVPPLPPAPPLPPPPPLP